MFNKRIKLYNIEIGSLVWVEFGETKHLFLEKMKRDYKENCFELSDCPHGLNLLHEFSYFHMAFLLTNKLNKVVAVVPVTEYKERDDNYHDINIILDKNDFGLNLVKKSTIKLDQLRFIDKSRVVKVEKKYINKTLNHLILKKVRGMFDFS